MAEQKSLVDNVKEGLSGVQERAEEMLHRAWPFRGGDEEGESRRTMSFPVDIYEMEDEFVLVGEMPGVKKDGVHVRVEENGLSISGRFRVALDEREQVAVREIPGADYQRTFTLSDAVDREKISAELRNGLLTIHLVKSEKVKPRQIEITA